MVTGLLIILLSFGLGIYFLLTFGIWFYHFGYKGTHGHAHVNARLPIHQENGKFYFDNLRFVISAHLAALYFGASHEWNFSHYPRSCRFFFESTAYTTFHHLPVTSFSSYQFRFIPNFPSIFPSSHLFFTRAYHSHVSSVRTAPYLISHMELRTIGRLGNYLYALFLFSNLIYTNRGHSALSTLKIF